MFLDDLFYPGNPKKREKIKEYNKNLRLSYEKYCTAWNKWAELMNEAFSKCAAEPMRSKKIDLLKKDIQKDKLGDCMQEIKDVTDKAGKIVKSIIDYMELSDVLPKGWETSGIKIKNLEKSKILEIGKKISGVASVELAGFLGYYTFIGVTVISELISVSSGVVASIGALACGAAAGIVVAATGFIVTELVSSAITGAIERKKLDEAIKLCEELEIKVTKPLSNAKESIEEFTNGMRNKLFDLGDGYYLVGKPDGTYVIMELLDLSANKSDNTKEVFFIPVA